MYRCTQRRREISSGSKREESYINLKKIKNKDNYLDNYTLIIANLSDVYSFLQKSVRNQSASKQKTQKGTKLRTSLYSEIYIYKTP